MRESVLQRVWRWLRRAWHRPSITWPFSHIIAFLRALPLLALWLGTAALLFFTSLAFLRLVGVEMDESGGAVTTLVGALIAGLIGFGVQQWQTLQDQERERREQRQQALSEIEELRDALRAREYVRALSLYRAFRERYLLGDWRYLGVEDPLRMVWMGAAPNPLRTWVELYDGQIAPSVNRQCVEALVWGWRLDEKQSGWVEDTFAQLVSEEEICVLSDVLTSDEDGLLLLRSPVIGEQLVKLEQKQLNEESGRCLELLRALRRQPVRLPVPWHREKRPADPPTLADGVERLGLSFNPFGPLRAELDPKLWEYRVWPSPMQQIQGPKPSLVFGPPGSGKTAGALLLTYRCLWPKGAPEERALPVNLSFPLEWPGTFEAWLDVLGESIGWELLRISALDPYSLFEQEPSTATAIASLLLRHFGPIETLKIHLQMAALEAGSARDYVLAEARRLTGELASEGGSTSLSIVSLLDLIGKARPTGLHETYLFIDLPSGTGERYPRTVLESLQLLLEMASPLASRGIHLKVFLPRHLHPLLASSWFEEPIFLAWTETELLDMLHRRLERVSVERQEGTGLQSLEQLCKPEARDLDPDDRLVRAAGGSPRRLVELGNRMLSRVEDDGLTPDILP